MSAMKQTILLVDDDEDFVFLQQKHLEASGFRVITTDSAASARQMVNEVSPDLAIVDLMMEEPDAGFLLCYQLKKKLPRLPIILCTGIVSETGIDFDVTTGEERSWIKADAILHKPLRYEQLKREVDRLLEAAAA